MVILPLILHFRWSQTRVWKSKVVKYHLTSLDTAQEDDNVESSIESNIHPAAHMGDVCLPMTCQYRQLVGKGPILSRFDVLTDYLYVWNLVTSSLVFDRGWLKVSWQNITCCGNIRWGLGFLLFFLVPSMFAFKVQLLRDGVEYLPCQNSYWFETQYYVRTTGTTKLGMSYGGY